MALEKKRGPNFMKLAFHRATVLAVPDGVKDPYTAGLEFFINQDKFKSVMKESFEFAEAAIELVKQSRDNPYGNDEEVIAGVILEQIEQRKAELRQARKNAG